MKVLVIGSGGREHALAWKIAQSPLVDKLYCAPGNPGMEQLAECVPIGVLAFDKLVAFAQEREIDLAVVGPEAPLAGGLVDRLEGAGRMAFGPSAEAAQLEASKSFAKGIMARHGIPTAAHAEFTDLDAAIEYVNEQGAPIVIKADGLAAGKGVTVAQDLDAAVHAIQVAMADQAFGEAGRRILVEECLEGEEASILAFTDGRSIVPMASSQDHKAIYDGDKGPNTGGMGAYSPAPVVTPSIFSDIVERVLEPCVAGMAREGCPYKGVLYAGLMITDAGPKVIEFNCRFGDPEVQAVLPRMASDVVPLLLACCDGTLEGSAIEWDERACVTVVMASGGYPKAYQQGTPITGIEDAEAEDGVIAFHAGTKRSESGVVTQGGRVLDVTALGSDIAAAIDKAYRAVGRIRFEGAHYRTDIGQKALRRLELKR